MHSRYFVKSMTIIVTGKIHGQLRPDANHHRSVLLETDRPTTCRQPERNGLEARHQRHIALFQCIDVVGFESVDSSCLRRVFRSSSLLK